MNTVKIELAEPTKEQLEIAELAAPLAKYMEDNGMVRGVVLVTMDGVSLYWEGFTADYANNFTKIGNYSVFYIVLTHKNFTTSCGLVAHGSVLLAQIT